MTLNEARLIREIKKRCTYRYLASIYYSKDEIGHGNQGWGEELCRKALKVLYPDDNIWMMDKPEEKFGKEWREENLSKFSKNADYYWWE